MKIRVYAPTGLSKTRDSETQGVHTWPSLHDSTVALVDNSKPNADVFLGFVGELLRERFNCSANLILKGDETGTSGPLSEEKARGVAETAVAALVGVGD